jgi:hypothetical protein
MWRSKFCFNLIFMSKVERECDLPREIWYIICEPVKLRDFAVLEEFE